MDRKGKKESKKGIRERKDKNVKESREGRTKKGIKSGNFFPPAPLVSPNLPRTRRYLNQTPTFQDYVRALSHSAKKGAGSYLPVFVWRQESDCEGRASCLSSHTTRRPPFLPRPIKTHDSRWAAASTPPWGQLCARRWVFAGRRAWEYRGREKK